MRGAEAERYREDQELGGVPPGAASAVPRACALGIGARSEPVARFLCSAGGLKTL
jgi:hypothetical protein